MKQAHPSRSYTAGLRLFSFAALMAVWALPLTCAWAIESQGSMLSRLDRIEQRLAELQAPTSGAGATTVGTAAQLEVSLAQIHEEMRYLRGQIEELTHHQAQLHSSMKRLEKDADLRLEALERSATAATLQAGGQPPVSAPTVDAADTAAPETPANVDNGRSANEAYQSAFDALNNGQYPQAEQQFSQFITRYPDHNLIGNAYYWLGETFYVQERYDEAADQFRQGFQVLPEGPKAPENLLRLGMTLNVLERKKEACIILGQLLTKYKGRSESTLRKASRESEKLGCN